MVQWTAYNMRWFVTLALLNVITISAFDAIAKCPVKNVEQNNDGELTSVITSTKRPEEIWIKFGDKFQKLLFRLRINNKWNREKSFIFDRDLIIHRDDIFPLTGANSSWSLMIVNVVKINRVGRDTIVIRVVLNKRSYDLDTHLWWRKYDFVEFYMYAEGNLQTVVGCEHPFQAQANGSTGELSFSNLPIDNDSSILHIVLPIVLILIVIVVIAISLVIYIRKRQMMLVNTKNLDEDPTYESMEEMVSKKRDQIFSQPLPPIPSWQETTKPQIEPQTEKETKCENHYTAIPAPENKSFMASNALYTYDVPRASPTSAPVTSSPSSTLKLSQMSKTHAAPLTLYLKWVFYR